MGPKRENMISKSASVVTGFNLQTKRTFSGGLIFASGKSPIYYHNRNQNVTNENENENETNKQTKKNKNENETKELC